MSEPHQRQEAPPPTRQLGGSVYHAFALDTGHGFKVRPAHAQVNGAVDQAFIFKNKTSYNGWVTLPPEVTGGIPTDPVPVAAYSWVSIPLRGGGEFSYVVVLKTDRGFMSVPGESDPVIIIDPPTP